MRLLIIFLFVGLNIIRSASGNPTTNFAATTNSKIPTTIPQTTVKRHRPVDHQSPTVYIVVVVVLIVAMIATTSIYCYRRRRTTKHTFATETSHSTCVENMHRDDDIPVTSLDDAIIVEDGTSFKGIEHVTRQKDDSDSDDGEKRDDSGQNNDGKTSSVMDLYSDAMEESSSESEMTGDEVGDRTANDGNTSTVMDLYSDAMEESSSEEELTGDEIENIGRDVGKNTDTCEVTVKGDGVLVGSPRDGFNGL